MINIIICNMKTLFLNQYKYQNKASGSDQKIASL